MKVFSKFIPLTSALLACATVVHGQATPALTGVVQGGVTTINTNKLLAQLNHGSSDLVLLAAHRGYWINSPENSDPALRAAFDAGVEIIEIDLRLSQDGVLMVSHDADIQKETTGTGNVATMTAAAIQALQLRDRKGNPQNLHMLAFKDALNILASYQSGSLSGPVIIADLKDGNPWPAYLQGIQDVQSTLVTASQPAVLFKTKMKNLPSIATINAELSSHPNIGHLVPTINPEDAAANANGFDGPDWDPSLGAGNWSPYGQNFQALLADFNASPPLVQQFEVNTLIPGDGGSAYISPNGPLNNFATYYQPSFYPEGVSGKIAPNFNMTLCCYLANLYSSTDPNNPQDKRGVLSYSLYYQNSSNIGTSTITSDNLAETLNFLVSLGKRNVSEIQ